MNTKEDLDFLHVRQKSDNLNEEFHRMAKELFESFVFIKMNGSRFCLTDIEFYLLAEWHQDFFTYAKPEQKIFGKLLRHNSGIDLTFGIETENIWGGILIRGIIEMDKFFPTNGCWYSYKKLIDNPVPKGIITYELSYSIEKFRDITLMTSKKRKGLTPERFKKNVAKIGSNVFSNIKEDSRSIDDFASRKYRYCL